MFRNFNVVVEVLILVAAVNLGLIGFLDYSLIADVIGVVATRVFYAVVGVAALYELIAWKPVHRHLAPRHTREAIS